MNYALAIGKKEIQPLLTRNMSNNLTKAIESLPEQARDIKINLQNLFSLENQILSPKQILGASLACAFNLKDKNLISFFKEKAQEYLSEEEISAVRISANIMAMNNIYYRFLHLIGDNEYSQMQVGLRMRGLIEHKIDVIDFEVFSLAVSILNGCEMCIQAHSQQLIKHKISKNQIQLIAKIVAIINAFSVSLNNDNNLLN